MIRTFAEEFRGFEVIDEYEFEYGGVAYSMNWCKCPDGRLDYAILPTPEEAGHDSWAVIEALQAYQRGDIPDPVVDVIA